jgi:Ca2+-binding EF-hand superfamily protein
MAMGRLLQSITDGRPSQIDRLQRRRHLGMRVIATRYGNCLVWLIKTVGCIVSCAKHAEHGLLRTGNGTLSETELQTALVNGDWTAFDPHTVRMMIRMFDTDRSGDINFEEFWYVYQPKLRSVEVLLTPYSGLWGFLAAWRKLFDNFLIKEQSKKRGRLDFEEFSGALVDFGYRLSTQFVDLLFRTYDRGNQGSLSFDLFVQACISLKRMTDVFKKYDEDRDGYITLSL